MTLPIVATVIGAITGKLIIITGQASKITGIFDFLFSLPYDYYC